ncbi:MAG: hypothetical protein AAGG65_00610 [Pseudomonadota bacterium]
MFAPIPDRYLIPLLALIVAVASVLPLGSIDMIGAGLLDEAGS